MSGRVVLVTGSSRGIGAGIARRFADDGDTVIVHGRDGDAIAAVVEAVTAGGGRAHGYAGDLTRWPDVERLRDAIAADVDDPDVVVANAGGNAVRPGPVEDLTSEQWLQITNANLTATFHTVKAFLPAMKQRGRGSIVTVSSAAVSRPSAQSPVAYTAAKAGIEALTRSTAAQAGPSGVRVNCVSPETILTERTARQIPPDVQEQMIAAHPLPRLGRVEDVADAVFFLSSPAASWLTGVTLEVSGGSTWRR